MCWRTALRRGPDYLKSAAILKIRVITWIPPVVFVKFKFKVTFNVPSCVCICFSLFLVLSQAQGWDRDGSERLKKHGPRVGRHHLLFVIEVCGSEFWVGRCLSIAGQVDPGLCFTHGIHFLGSVFYLHSLNFGGKLSTIRKIIFLVKNAPFPGPQFPLK